MITVYRCELCAETSPEKRGRCKKCGYAKLEEVAITEMEYCEKFAGHDEGVVLIAGTERYMSGVTEECEDRGDWVPARWFKVRRISHEHFARCAKCGNERTFRCDGCKKERTQFA